MTQDAKRRRMFFATAVVLAVMSGNPGGAQALERGQCASPQELSAELQVEGEGNFFSFIAAMNRTAFSAERNESINRAQFVAANTDRSRFYVLLGNAPLGSEATEFCVSHVGRDLEINDYRQDRPPEVTRYTFNDDEALQQCETIRENLGNVLCNNRDRVLEISDEQDGLRLALQGIFLSESGQDSGLFTMIADPENDQSFTTLTSASRGATTVLESGTSFSLAPSIIAQLEQMQD